MTLKLTLMNRGVLLATFLICAVLVPNLNSSAASANGLPMPGRIVFLGDSITYSG